MKREDVLFFLCAFALSFCLSFGGTACAVTGLGLNCSLVDLACGCLLICLIFSLLPGLRRGGLVLLGLLAAAAVLGLITPGFRQDALSVAARVARLLQSGYGMATPELLANVTGGDHLMPMLAVAALIAAAVCWTVLRRVPAALSVFLSLLPVGLCCMVTDTVPTLWCILLWLAGLLLLLLTHPVRLRDPAQGVQLTGLLMIPVILAVTVLAVAVPQSSYRPPDFELSSIDALGDWLSGYFPYIGQTTQGDLVISFSSELGDRVELDKLNGPPRGQGAVMEVQTGFSGCLYLRGQDFDLYDGVSWSSSPEREETVFCPNGMYTEDGGTVSVRMLSRHSRIYLPYWPEQSVTLTGGAVENVDRLTDYSFTCMVLSEDWSQIWRMVHASSTRPPEDKDFTRYLELPESTRTQADLILRQLNLMGNACYQAQAIADYVQSSAVYDLKPPTMPEGYDDFAVWFLNEADGGYCTHFATATAVLLRAAGIPARYVEGYMIEVEENESHIVRQEMAHAWVEYYLEGMGWIPLESTPGDTEEETTETTEATQPSETTRPSEITRPTLPDSTDTEVTDPASPEVTEPGQTTVPSSQPGQTEDTPTEQRNTWLPKLLLGVAIGLGVAAAVVGQWLLRRRYCLLRQRRGKPNTQALARFREAKRLARLSKLPVPEELNRLADRACFSQHQLTASDLAAFDGFLRAATDRLRAAKLPMRLIYRFFFAAY